MGVLVENWGGELSTNIGVSSEGVITRQVDLYAQQGDSTAKRRFDFGSDLQSVKRIHSDEPYYCRISPRGKGEATDGGGYGRKITIESVNGGLDYLEYAPMVDVCKLPDGSGFTYPTLQVENSKCETPAELKTWAESVLESYCTPKVTYEVNAVQAAIEGVDVQGVSLGDVVHIVDGYFGDGLRLSGRVTEMTVDELNERDISIKVGYIGDTLANTITSTAKQVAQMQQAMSTAEYIQNLLDRINAEINATGGYTYITEGQGIRTYDAAVSDPLVGSEASAVVEIKGGTIRIANSKTAQGEWKWKSVFTSGHIAANLVTAANITTGFISDASGVNSWNLDTGVFSTAQGYIGGFTIGSSALYNNLNTIYGANKGVYVGTNGIAANGDYDGVVIKDGSIETYNISGGSSTKSGSIVSGQYWSDIGGGGYGLQLDANVIELTLNGLSIIDKAHPSTGGGLGYSTPGNYITLSIISFSTSTNKVTVTKSDWRCRFAHGILVFQELINNTGSYDLAPASHTHAASAVTSGKFDAARIPTLEISKISGLQSALDGKSNTNHTHSGYATQSWVNSQGFASASLSGSTLTLTY